MNNENELLEIKQKIERLEIIAKNNEKLIRSLQQKAFGYYEYTENQITEVIRKYANA